MKKQFIWVVVAILIINFGCDDMTELQFGNSVSGIVRDSKGNLLSDVYVFVFYEYDLNTTGLNRIISPDFLYSINGVILTSFTAIANNPDITLNWTTVGEESNSGFEIERKDNSNYNKVGFVGGHGTTSDTIKYTFTDRNLQLGNYYYRLKQIDFNGNFEYSSEVEVEIISYPSVSKLELNYPNPFSNSTNVIFNLRKTCNAKLELCTFNTKKLIHTLFDSQSNPGRYNILLSSDSIPTGAYKIILYIKEPESTYTSEINILKNNGLELTGLPNSITENGRFSISSSDFPIWKEFHLTGPSSPEQIGELKIRNIIKLVFYKPGYKILQKDLMLNADEGREIMVQLESE